MEIKLEPGSTDLLHETSKKCGVTSIVCYVNCTCVTILSLGFLYNTSVSHRKTQLYFTNLFVIEYKVLSS